MKRTSAQAGYSTCQIKWPDPVSFDTAGILILQVLRDLRYRAIAASTQEQALDTLAKHGNIDLVLSDVGLPGMNGRELDRIARQDRPNLRMLFMTSYSAEAAVRGDFLDDGYGDDPETIPAGRPLRQRSAR